MKKTVLSKIIIVLCVLVCISLAVCSCKNNSNGDGPVEPGAGNGTPGTENETPGSTETPGNTETPGDNNEPTNTKVTYKVTVVDENDQPLAGATVQMCVGDICRLPVPTDASGVATLELDAADYVVKVTLNGYNGEAQYSFAADSTELKVTLTKNA